nr:neuronal PAS domain-containing protein 4 isoform X4 [Anser cygnoides]
MTIFCSHCHRPLQAEASCLPGKARSAPGVSKPFRSTKSASKARRDQINAELQALRSLLPISAREKERLSYLHTMALVCLRLRGAHLFPPGTRGHRRTCPVPRQHGSARGAAPGGASRCAPPADSAPPAGPVLGAELLSLLPGFLLVLSAGGKLVYVSENVSQVLGLSMVRPGRCGVAVAVPARLSGGFSRLRARGVPAPGPAGQARSVTTAPRPGGASRPGGHSLRHLGWASAGGRVQEAPPGAGAARQGFASPQKSRLSARCAHPRPSACSTGVTGPWRCVGASWPHAGRPPPLQPSWPSALRSHGWLQRAMLALRTTCSTALMLWT